MTNEGENERERGGGASFVFRVKGDQESLPLLASSGGSVKVDGSPSCFAFRAQEGPRRAGNRPSLLVYG